MCYVCLFTFIVHRSFIYVLTCFSFNVYFSPSAFHLSVHVLATIVTHLITLLSLLSVISFPNHQVIVLFITYWMFSHIRHLNYFPSCDPALPITNLTLCTLSVTPHSAPDIYIVFAFSLHPIVLCRIPYFPAVCS